MNKKQSALALHLIHYYLIDLVRLHMEYVKLDEEFKLRKSNSLLDHLNSPEIPYKSIKQEPYPEHLEAKARWLYGALYPVLYILEENAGGVAPYFHFSPLIKWLKDKMAAYAKLFGYCWCKGCPIAREEDVKENPDKYTHIPPAYGLTNTGMTYAPAGKFRSSMATEGEEPQECVEWRDPIKEYREWRENLVSAAPGDAHYGEGCIDDIIPREAKLVSLWPDKFDATQSFEVRRGYLLDKYDPQHKALIEAYNVARARGLEAFEETKAAYAVHKAYCDELILLVRENGKGFIRETGS